jgi:hypothetical membrane protein
MRRRRALAWSGIAGPLGFVSAWATAGALTRGYSPVEDAISRLAAVHAETRWLMTGGFVWFGVAVPVYSLALRDALGGRAWLAAMGTGLATLGVAAVPLDASTTTDLVHGGFATVGYATLALTPLAAASSLSTRGHHRAAAVSRVVGVLTAACLAATVIGPAHGLLQRAGLTLGDAWLAGSAVALIRGIVEAPAPPGR